MSQTPHASLAQASTEFAALSRTIETLAPGLRRALHPVPLPISRDLLDHLAAIESHLAPLRLSLELLTRSMAHVPLPATDPTGTKTRPSTTPVATGPLSGAREHA